MHGGYGTSRVKAVQVMVDQMKMTPEEAQTNLTIAPKLRQHWIGPYSITKVISRVAYCSALDSYNGILLSIWEESDAIMG